MSTSLRTSKLIENCTPSINYDTQIKSACEAFDYQMYQVIDETGQVCFIPNIMGLTDPNLVDILAWQFNVDFYDTRDDLEFRKALVQMSIEWHKTKGTVKLVENVIDTYWPVGAIIEEWFQYKSPFPPNYPDPAWHDRYRFRVTVHAAAISTDQEWKVLALIDRYKPVSRWCEGVFWIDLSDCSIGWTGAMLKFISRESQEPTNYP